MDLHGRTLRFGAAMIICAVLARLGLSGAFLPMLDWFARPQTQSFLVYLETGRKVRFSPSVQEFTNPDEEIPPVTEPPEAGEAPPELPVLLGLLPLLPTGPVFKPEPRR